MSEAPASLAAARERSADEILAALAVNVLSRLQKLEPARRIEVLQIAIALTAANIQQQLREQQLPRDE